MISIKRLYAMLILLLISIKAYASITTNIYSLSGEQAYLGTIVATNTPNGLLLTPHLTNLPPGRHGFHVHVNPNCGNHGLDAGGHLDPANTGKHKGPYASGGHLGDLPALWVDKKGNATLPVLAPHLSEKQLRNHALIIHAGGDNYADTPVPLGGGGEHIACGVIVSKIWRFASTQ